MELQLQKQIIADKIVNYTDKEREYITRYSASTYQVKGLNYNIITNLSLSYDSEVFKNNKLVALIESKVRKEKYFNYDTLFLEDYKYKELMKYSDYYKIPVYYFNFFENSNLLRIFYLNSLKLDKPILKQMNKCTACGTEKTTKLVHLLNVSVAKTVMY